MDENGHYYEVGGSKLISPPPKFDAGGPTTFNPPPSPHRALSNNIMSSNEKSDGSVPAASLLQASAKLKHKHPTINSVHHPFNVNQVADMKPPNPNPIAAFDKASSKKRLPLSTKDKKDDRYFLIAKELFLYNFIFDYLLRLGWARWVLYLLWYLKPEK